jgi:predicted Zn-dependent protease
VAQEAITMALRSRGAVRYEPGRYTAILSPTAVGQLLKQNAMAFDSGKNAPFVLPTPTRDGRTTRITERVADPRITMWTDPSDPDYGEIPFFGDGYPCGKTTWIERGILKAIAFDPGDAAKRQVPPAKWPYGFQMTGGPTSIDEMIASCERGIYVNRLSDLQISDQRSATMTGVTRDGCFLVRNRKIEKPIANFRFYESPLLVLTKILALGPPQRAAYGFSPTKEMLWNTFDPWPYAPVVTPPLMVEDFNFSSLSDAV